MRLLGSFLKAFVPFVFAAAAVVGCSSEVDDESTGESADMLQSTPLADGEMKKLNPQPNVASWPKPYDQPDSTGWFEERGKCGPTAVANTLKLYGINNVTPAQADRDGVNWLVGSRGINIEWYMQTKHAELGCTLEHPEDGPKFLREKIAGGHPVMVWFNTQGGLTSHWVTVVHIAGSPGAADERAVVMSWGAYYTISMKKLDDAWRNVYWIRRPSVVCTSKSSIVH